MEGNAAAADSFHAGAAAAKNNRNERGFGQQC
jgi:hypothetical protein